MNGRIVAGVCLLACLAGATPTMAQSMTVDRERTWKGGYAGGFVGAGLQPGDPSETVRFDTNLDGAFSDVVRTVAGVDAFSPGFCGGRAASALPSAGCGDDEDDVEFGGRAGYDWQAGRIVVGGLFDISRAAGVDSVTAFSTTPAFYAFTRELKTLAAVRGRVGVGLSRLLLYGTGGAAWGRITHSFTTSNGVNTFVAVNQRDGATEGAWGYQGGGGLEARLGGRWSVVGEYLFTSIDDRDVSTIRSQGPAPATNPFILVNSGGTDLQRADRFDLHSVRASLVYRF